MGKTMRCRDLKLRLLTSFARAQSKVLSLDGWRGEIAPFSFVSKATINARWIFLLFWPTLGRYRRRCIFKRLLWSQVAHNAHSANIFRHSMTDRFGCAKTTHAQQHRVRLEFEIIFAGEKTLSKFNVVFCVRFRLAVEVFCSPSNRRRQFFNLRNLCFKPITSKPDQIIDAMGKKRLNHVMCSYALLLNASTNMIGRKEWIKIYLIQSFWEVT